MRAPPERGVKMFQLAQTNIFTPERKKGGGHPLAIRRPLLARARLGGGLSGRGRPGSGRRPCPR